MLSNQQSIVKRSTARNLPGDILSGYSVVNRSTEGCILHREESPLTNEEREELASLIVNHFEKFGVSVTTIIIFGSSVDPDRSMKVYSDLDFTVIIKSFESSYDVREKNSPELKHKVISAGINAICGFNIYTQDEFNSMVARNAWLARTMLTNPLIVRDNGYMNQHINRNIENIHEDRLSKYEWLNSTTNRLNDIQAEVLSRVQRILRESVDSDVISRWYDIQISKNQYIESTRQRSGRIITNPSVSSHYDIDPLEYEVEVLYPFLHPTHIADHIDARNTALELGYGLPALYHTYIVSKVIMLQHLYKRGVLALDGEVAQLFFREFKDFIAEDDYLRFFYSLHKAEQILGRSTGLYSFDIDSSGYSFFEDVASITDTMTQHIEAIDAFVEYLQTMVVHPTKKSNYFIRSRYDISDQVSQSLFPTESICNNENNADYILDTGSISTVSPFFLLEVFSRFYHNRIQFVFVGDTPVTSHSCFIEERQTPCTSIFAYRQGLKPISEEECVFNFNSTYINLNYK